MIDINGRWINNAHVIWAEIVTENRATRRTTQRLVVCFADGSRWPVDVEIQAALDAIKAALP